MGTRAQVCHLPGTPGSCFARAQGEPRGCSGSGKASNGGEPSAAAPQGFGRGTAKDSSTVLSLQPHHLPPAILQAQGAKPGSLSSWSRAVPPHLERQCWPSPSQMPAPPGCWGKDAPHALCLCPGCQAWPKVALGQRCACLQPRAQGVRVSRPGTSGGGHVQTLRPVGREEVIWGPAVEKLSVCD